MNTKIRKLKNIVFIGIIISMVVSIPVFAQSSAVINNSFVPLVDPNWGNGGSEGGTHKVMGGQAYYILGNDKGTAIRNNFDEYVTNPENGWSETAINTIENYCVTTDQIENDLPSLALGHFYGLGGTNYWGGTEPTAYTRWNNHYWEAVHYYNIDKYISYKQLGMALHYLCDLNAPHHATNLTSVNPNSLHMAYEIWVDTNINDFKTYSAPPETYTYMLDTNISFKQRADNFSAFARAQINDCNKGIFPLWFDSSTAKPPTLEMATRAQRASVGLLYRFLHDTGRV